MSEIAAVAGLFACTGSFIAAGVYVGTHYIDKVFRIEGQHALDGTPLVIPSRPSGSNWHLTNTA